MNHQFSKWPITLLIVCSFFAYNCKNNKPQEPVIARVGTQTLTLNMVKNFIPNELNLDISEPQIQNYIERWINSQVLYQEALRQRIHKLPHVIQRLEEVQRELVVAMFLDMQMPDELVISDSEIETYYNEHKKEFIRPEETRHIMMILIDNQQKANRIRRRLLQKEDMAEIARENSLDPSSENGGDLGFIARNRLLQRIGDTAFNLSVGRISLPIWTDLGYHIIKVVEIREKDEIQELEEVHDRIKERLLVQKRNEGYDQLLATLKESASIQKNFKLWRDLTVQGLHSDTTTMENGYNP